MRSKLWLANLLLTAGLAACAPKPKTESIQQVMAKIVDPSADAVWGAVTSTVTDKGAEDRRPRTDADWREVRAQALRLIEGARLLQSARPVGANAHSPLADAATPGTRTAAQITADIKADPARFYSAAAVLQQTAQDALAAIDRQDVDALISAGEAMDLACEGCHAAYWYPRNAYRPFPGADAFGKIATRP